MQRIVVVAGGAEAHQLVQAAVASIREAQRKECSSVQLKVFRLRVTQLRSLTPADSASYLAMRLLSDDVHDFVLQASASPVPASALPALPGAVLCAQLFSAGSTDAPLKTQAEINIIKEERLRAHLRERIKLEDWQVATLAKLRLHVQRFRPQIVQFSGHGERRLMYFFHDETRLAQHEVQPEDVAVVLADVRCVVLQCCQGKATAQALHERGIPFVVSYDGLLSDKTAHKFSQLFWSGMYAGRGVRRSFAVAADAVGDGKYELLAADGAEDLAFSLA
eukprot:m.243547 g.243547  ORF g.243547 m.243547 type:complete len:278 (-) comp10950_c0_seq6:88-921(-)